jgi:hypothetical protein
MRPPHNQPLQPAGAAPRGAATNRRRGLGAAPAAERQVVSRKAGVPMEIRRATQGLSLTTALWLVVATPSFALTREKPSPRFPSDADLVAIVTPIERHIVDAKAFLPRSGGDSIPVTTIEVRFETVLGIRGISSPDTFTLRYHLRREVPAEMRIGTAVMRWYPWRMGDVFIGDPCGKPAVDSLGDFNPGRSVQFLVTLKRSDEGRYVCAGCPAYCIRRLSQCYHRDMHSSAANKPLQPAAPQGGR